MLRPNISSALCVYDGYTVSEDNITTFSNNTNVARSFSNNWASSTLRYGVCFYITVSTMSWKVFITMLLKVLWLLFIVIRVDNDERMHCRHLQMRTMMMTRQATVWLKRLIVNCSGHWQLCIVKYKIVVTTNCTSRDHCQHNVSYNSCVNRSSVWATAVADDFNWSKMTASLS